MAPLLSIRGLTTWFNTDRGTVRAVDGVDLDVVAGETVALVGESGSGKSVLGLSVMGLVPPPGRIVSGGVHFEGTDLTRTSTDRRRALRGNRMAMIFQDPMTSLNPVMRVGRQIAEAVRVHTSLSRAEARYRSIELLGEVGISEPERRARDFPHQLSGGMRQRVMIAMALSCNPSLLIADEPTTALDVTIQAQILDLIRSLQERTGMGILFVTHDLGVVAEIADRVAVLYAGRIVEEGPCSGLLARPRMPYTAGLLASVPRLDGAPGRLQTIRGTVPSPLARPAGCAFHPRCDFATQRCAQTEPAFESVDETAKVRCHHWRELAVGAGEE